MPTHCLLDFVAFIHTRVAFYILGLEIVFQNIPPLRSIRFCMRLNQLSKHFCHSDWGIFKTFFLNPSTASSGVGKRWPLILFFYLRVYHTTFDSSNRCFECLEMQLFEPMYDSSHCHGEEWTVFGGWFSWFLPNKWLCTTQNWIYWPNPSSGTIATCPVFPKKQTNICLEVLRVSTTVDYCLLSGSYA